MNLSVMLNSLYGLISSLKGQISDQKPDIRPIPINIFHVVVAVILTVVLGCLVMGGALFVCYYCVNLRYDCAPPAYFNLRY